MKHTRIEAGQNDTPQCAQGDNSIGGRDSTSRSEQRDAPQSPQGEAPRNKQSSMLRDGQNGSPLNSTPRDDGQNAPGHVRRQLPVDITRLRNDLRLLDSLVLDLLTAITDLELRQIPQTWVRYQLRIGCWERQMLQAEVDMRCARRACELLQEQTSRGRVTGWSQIEQQVNDEFAEWRTLLQQKARRYTQAVQYAAAHPAPTASCISQLSRLYRTLAERIHPSLHSITPREERLFELVRDAYAAADVEVLASLEIATRGHAAERKVVGMTSDQIAVEIEICEAYIGILQERLDRLTSSFPYNLKNQLQDSEWVNQQVHSIIERIARYNREAGTYRERCRHLARKAS